MRPSKLRLPDSTDTKARRSATAESAGSIGPGVADAGGATESDQVEPERLEVGQQPGARRSSP